MSEGADLDRLAVAQFKMSMARSMYEGDEGIWYCTHLLGERAAFRVDSDLVEAVPTWPGDRFFKEDEEALNWMCQPPEQASLGVPPEVEAEEPPEDPPSPVRQALVNIHDWVEAVRQRGQILWLKEVRRTHDHSWVLVEESTPEGLGLVFHMAPKRCGECGLLAYPRVPEEFQVCPDGIGCRDSRKNR